MKHTLLIDSRDRDAGMPGSYRIILPKMYENVIGARLLTAEIPSTFYVFTASSGNTTLYVTIDGQSVPANIILSDGNYGSTEMQIVLVEALNANTDLTWSVSISSTTQRITLSNTALIDFSVDASGLGKYLGFSGVQLSEEGSVTSSSVVSLNPHTYILLDIYELNGIDEGVIGGGGAGRGAFCKIPFNTSNSSEYAILDVQRGTPRVDVNVARLDRLRIRLRFHEDGEIIDFNGVDHSFTLEIITRDRGDPVHNTAPIIANAASTAAAAAAAAAIAATRSAQSMNLRCDARDAARKKEFEDKSRYKIPKKAYKWIFVALLGLAAAIYLYMKRTRPVDVPEVASHFTPTISQRPPQLTSMYQPSASRFGGRPT